MENSSEINRQLMPLKINLDSLPKHRMIVGPTGEGRSFYAEILRERNPGMVVIDIDLPSDKFEIMKREPESYSKLNKELSTELLAETSEVLKESTGVILSADQLLQLIDSDPQLCFSLVLNGPHDTEVRGDLASALSEKLLNKSWGTYGDKDFDVDMFVHDLHKAAVEAGYTVES